MSAIENSDAPINSGELDMGSAADAFLAKFQEDASKKKPSDEGKEEETDASAAAEDDDEPDTDDSEDEGSDESPDADADEDSDDKEDDKPKKYVEGDDHFVKVKVGEEELDVPVKDLRRLYGQEAALTRRSQEVAEQRKTADTETAKAVATLNVMLQRAQEKAKPYKEIDFLTAARNLSEEDITVLREQATEAFEEEKFLSTELQSFMGQIETSQRNARVAEAQATVKALGDPADPHYIEGWDQKLYEDIRTFATSEGIGAEVVNNLTDAASLKLIHMAMLYKKGTGKVQVVRKNKTPTKIVKRSGSPVTDKTIGSAKAEKAFKRLKVSGKVDDAADAFLARMNSDED